jgi:PKHD-type hydroxylase
MLVCIPDVLTSAQVSEARALLEKAEWVDGRATAGHLSTKVKDNEQVPENDPAARQIGSLILAALSKNALFSTAALPLKVSPPMFNRYQGGQTYGAHVDNAIRGLPGGGRLRTDLSATVFLTDPKDYEGGELTIEDTYGTQHVKLPAGHMVLYRSGSLHQVKPVTRGSRWASFFFIQSMVRQESDRELLLNLDLGIQGLNKDRPGHPSSLTLTGVYHNLVQRWAEV